MNAREIKVYMSGGALVLQDGNFSIRIEGTHEQLAQAIHEMHLVVADEATHTPPSTEEQLRLF